MPVAVPAKDAHPLSRRWSDQLGKAQSAHQVDLDWIKSLRQVHRIVPAQSLQTLATGPAIASGS